MLRPPWEELRKQRWARAPNYQYMILRAYDPLLWQTLTEKMFSGKLYFFNFMTNYMGFNKKLFSKKDTVQS